MYWIRLEEMALQKRMSLVLFHKLRVWWPAGNELQKLSLLQLSTWYCYTAPKLKRVFLLLTHFMCIQETEALHQIQERLELLQEYLVSYSDCGVPVFSTSLTNMKSTINQLHDYLLECIALQMSSDSDVSETKTSWALWTFPDYKEEANCIFDLNKYSYWLLAPWSFFAAAPFFSKSTVDCSCCTCMRSHMTTV